MLNIDYKNIPVLVTGGAGFIGSHLVEKLIESGAQVTVLDDLSTGSLANLEQFLDKLKFIHGSITDIDACVQATINKKIVFHLAAMTSVPLCEEKQELCQEINIQGTKNILQASSFNKVEKFIFSSSAAVYGNNEGECLESSYCHPTSYYGYSKLLGENYCQEAKELQTYILRYFNVYGPKQNGAQPNAGVVAKFRHLFENNQPITIQGDGSQTRDFVGVDTVVQANMLMGLSATTSIKSVNVGTGKSTSIIELFYLLKKEYPHYSHEPLFIENKNHDICHSVANVDRLHTLINSYTEAFQSQKPKNWACS